MRNFSKFLLIITLCPFLAKSSNAKFLVQMKAALKDDDTPIVSQTDSSTSIDEICKSNEFTDNVQYVTNTKKGIFSRACICDDKRFGFVTNDSGDLCCHTWHLKGEKRFLNLLPFRSLAIFSNDHKNSCTGRDIHQLVFINGKTLKNSELYFKSAIENLAVSTKGNYICIVVEGKLKILSAFTLKYIKKDYFLGGKKVSQISCDDRSIDLFFANGNQENLVIDELPDKKCLTSKCAVQ